MTPGWGADALAVLAAARARWAREHRQWRPNLDDPVSAAGFFPRGEIERLAAARLWPLTPLAKTFIRGA